jgi:hypothetical protein
MSLNDTFASFLSASGFARSSRTMCLQREVATRSRRMKNSRRVSFLYVTRFLIGEEEANDVATADAGDGTVVVSAGTATAAVSVVVAAISDLSKDVDPGGGILVPAAAISSSIASIIYNAISALSSASLHFKRKRKKNQRKESKKKEHFTSSLPYTRALLKVKHEQATQCESKSFAYRYKPHTPSVRVTTEIARASFEF